MTSESSYQPRNGSDYSVEDESRSSNGTLLGDEDARSEQNNWQGRNDAPGYGSVGNYSTDRYENSYDRRERFRAMGVTYQNMNAAGATRHDAASPFHGDQENKSTLTDEHDIGDKKEGVMQTTDGKSQKKSSKEPRKKGRKTSGDKGRERKDPKKESKNREERNTSVTKTKD